VVLDESKRGCRHVRPCSEVQAVTRPTAAQRRCRPKRSSNNEHVYSKIDIPASISTHSANPLVAAMLLAPDPAPRSLGLRCLEDKLKPITLLRKLNEEKVIITKKSVVSICGKRGLLCMVCRGKKKRPETPLAKSRKRI
jgi:hypothetical protein